MAMETLSIGPHRRMQIHERKILTLSRTGDGWTKVDAASITEYGVAEQQRAFAWLLHTAGDESRQQVTLLNEKSNSWLMLHRISSPENWAYWTIQAIADEPSHHLICPLGGDLWTWIGKLMDGEGWTIERGSALQDALNTWADAPLDELEPEHGGNSSVPPAQP
jgi:hypothetical protein